MTVSSTNSGSGIIQAMGIGSGLDIQSLVTQLVSAEGAPEQNRLARKSADVATQFSALGTLKGALASFQSALKPLKSVTAFNSIKTKAEDSTIFTASASSSAAGGVYDVMVKQLATADKLLSKEFTAPSVGVSSSSAVVGTGTLSISLGSSTSTLTIGSSKNTLADIRDAINNASDNPGVQASIVYGQDGAHLSLTATKTGASNTLRISSSGGDGGLTQLEYSGVSTPNYSVLSTAADAALSVSGVEVQASTNIVTSAIDGVTINLVKADTSRTYELTVASDSSAVVGNLQQFVNAYNSLRSQFDKLDAYNSVSKTAGPMLGDPLLMGIEAQLRRLSLNAVSGLRTGYSSLASIGITSSTTGQLSLDSTKLQAALASQPTAVAQLFGATDGIAARLDSALTDMLGSTGNIQTRTQSLTSAQKQLAEDSARLQTQLAAIQQRYIAQFTALDKALAQMKQTSSYLTQQLNSISSIGNSNSSSR